MASAHRTFASCGRNWNLKNLKRRKKGNYCHKRRYRQNVLTWFRPNHPTFRPQEAWFDHCHPTGVRRAVGNFGHKRKIFALAVIDFGQGKMCHFLEIFEKVWPKLFLGQKLGFIEENLKNLERRKKGNYCHKRRYRQNVLTWFRPNHPTFRPQESWFDHCHPTGVRRPVGNFGHKRKKVALAVIDFGQGKKCRFRWIFDKFFLQEQSWPKISKIWFLLGIFFLQEQS